MSRLQTAYEMHLRDTIGYEGSTADISKVDPISLYGLAEIVTDPSTANAQRNRLRALLPAAESDVQRDGITYPHTIAQLRDRLIRSISTLDSEPDTEALSKLRIEVRGLERLVGYVQQAASKKESAEARHAKLQNATSKYPQDIETREAASQEIYQLLGLPSSLDLSANQLARLARYVARKVKRSGCQYTSASRTKESVTRLVDPYELPTDGSLSWIVY